MGYNIYIYQSNIWHPLICTITMFNQKIKIENVFAIPDEFWVYFLFLSSLLFPVPMWLWRHSHPARKAEISNSNAKTFKRWMAVSKVPLKKKKSKSLMLNLGYLSGFSISWLTRQTCTIEFEMSPGQEPWEFLCMQLIECHLLSLSIPSFNLLLWNSFKARLKNRLMDLEGLPDV